VTGSDLYKAALAMNAARWAGAGASLEQMKAICYCIRNRVKAGWGDGNWLTVLEEAEDCMGNLPGPKVKLDPNGKAFTRLLRDIDEIYYGGGRHEILEMATPEAGDVESAIGDAKYWFFVKQPHNPWFVENIIHDPDNHREAASMWLMLFFD
jgi:hypothetical protein